MYKPLRGLIMEDMKFCVVIPVYRHEHTVKAIAESISAKDLPVFLVDDGNTPEAKKILASIAEEVPNTTLVSYEKNGGKGFAVSEGLKAAFKAGYTHALQVDADGQHDLNALSFFIKASRRHPESLISAFPQYDESVPKSRLQGRKITNFWVNVETLSADIPDSMCGFRVYPLAKVVPVIKHISDFRMGFDIEILVRLKWKGLKMNFYPIQVKYPENGISNFHVVKDNIAISWMHTKLFFGMLIRLPILLKRKLKKHG